MVGCPPEQWVREPHIFEKNIRSFLQLIHHVDFMVKINFITTQIASFAIVLP